MKQVTFYALTKVSEAKELISRHQLDSEWKEIVYVESAHTSWVGLIEVGKENDKYYIVDSTQDSYYEDVDSLIDALIDTDYLVRD